MEETNAVFDIRTCFLSCMGAECVDLSARLELSFRMNLCIIYFDSQLHGRRARALAFAVDTVPLHRVCWTALR